MSRDLPIGTIVQSLLPPAVFLRQPDGGDEVRWAPADGSKLPDGSKYGQLTGSSNAPDLTGVANSYDVLDVVSTTKHGGELVQSAIPSPLIDADWRWFVSANHEEWKRVNNDVEQHEGQMDTSINFPSGAIVAQGQVWNYKQRTWSQPSIGTVNLFGMALKKNAIYYYVKIN